MAESRQKLQFLLNVSDVDEILKQEEHVLNCGDKKITLDVSKCPDELYAKFLSFDFPLDDTKAQVGRNIIVIILFVEPNVFIMPLVSMSILTLILPDTVF